MRKTRAAFLILTCLIVCNGMTCAQVKSGAEAVAGVAQTVAPLLPPPFGWILAGVGGLAGVVGAVAAGKNKTEIIKQAVAAGKPVSEALGSSGLFTKLLTERKWLMPIAGATLTGANQVLGLGLDGDTISQVNLLLGGTALAEFAKDAVVNRTAKAATAPVQPGG